jgi:CDGSH-type Zn-finger protein
VGRFSTREELLYLLTRACELEHNLACAYLYAGYSLKTDLREGDMSEEELVAVLRWKRNLAAVAVEEMLHLGQVCNMLTAIGGAPHFARTNFPHPATAFPLGLKIALEPFSMELIERFVCYELPEEGVLSDERFAEFMEIRKRAGALENGHTFERAHSSTEGHDIDFRTVGEFYHKIESAFGAIPGERLFIGDPRMQAAPNYLDFPRDLIEVSGPDTARAAIEMIVEQGESPSSDHPDAHCFVFDGIRREYAALLAKAKAENRRFDPVRPLISNPVTLQSDETAQAHRITNPVSREVAGLFNSAYALMLMMLARFFAHADETEEELRLLARATLRIMASGLRPLGEALAKLPAGHAYPGKNAGPGFRFSRNIHLLAHKRAAWIYFLERLCDIERGLVRLSNQDELPVEVAEATAAFESVAEMLAPYIPAAFTHAIRNDADERSARTTIRPEVDGPYIVRNLRTLTNSKGETLTVEPIVALCRCGGSAMKPFCDGTHARIGFSSAKSPDRRPDKLTMYEKSDGFKLLDNRGTCAHIGRCSRNLPSVFHHPGVFVTIEGGGSTEEIIEIVRDCPSGALGYARDGKMYGGEAREPEIYVAENASYFIRGSVELEGEPMNKGANHEHYALCRCGRSKNKPFCDGTHWDSGFVDPDN